METARLNTQLYQKMYAEQERYKSELMTMESAEILNHAYEYVTREDILLSMEYNDLSPKMAKALLKSDTPLADVFVKLESWQNNYIDHIWDAVVATADDVVRADSVKNRNELR